VFWSTASLSRTRPSPGLAARVSGVMNTVGYSPTLSQISTVYERFYKFCLLVNGTT